MVAKTANRYTHPIIAELFFPLPHFSVARYIASNTSNRKKNWNTVCTTASANPIFPPCCTNRKNDCYNQPRQQYRSKDYRGSPASYQHCHTYEKIINEQNQKIHTEKDNQPIFMDQHAVHAFNRISRFVYLK